MNLSICSDLKESENFSILLRVSSEDSASSLNALLAFHNRRKLKVLNRPSFILYVYSHRIPLIVLYRLYSSKMESNLSTKSNSQCGALNQFS
jgi:hypothetical protein